MGRPILSPGKKLTGEKSDRYTAIESFNPRISICNVSLANSLDPDQTVIVGAV